jgi:hypothetical protein
MSATPTIVLPAAIIEANKVHNADLRARVTEAGARQKLALQTIHDRMKQTEHTAKKLKEILEEKVKSQKKFAEALGKQKSPKMAANMKYDFPFFAILQ